MTQNPSHGRPAKEQYYASVSPRAFLGGLSSEKRYRAVVEQTADGIFLIDGTTKNILEANSRFEELLGYGRGELHGMSLYDLVPHDREGARANVDRVLKQKSYQVGERSYRRKDGSLVDVEVSASVIKHDDQEILCCVARDITERKRAEQRLRESEERHRAVVEQSVEGIYLLDPQDGCILESNKAFEELLGYTSEELFGMTIYDFIAHEPEDIDWHVERSLEVRRRHKGERRYRRKDGAFLEVEASAMVIPYRERQAVCCVVHDVTQRRASEEKLRKSETRLAEAQRIAHLGSWEWDVKTGEIFWSDETFRIYGYEPQEFTPDAEKLRKVVHPDDRETVDKNIHRALHKHEPYDIEHRIVRPGGEERVVHRQARVFFDDEGQPQRMAGTIHDITERKELEERLEHQAFHDSLTELPNRVLFLNRLAHALTQTGREGGPVAVLLLDLNHFKVINDSLGHDAGNVALVGVAKRLRASVRPGDTVGRIFGDEFAVLLGAPSGTDEARRVAGRIQERLQEPLEVEGQEVFVSPSIGIALGNTQDSPEEVLRRADLAMYAAKKRGKAKCEEYRPDMEAPVANHMDLERDLRRAIEREEFEAYYQPIVDLQTGETVAVEALARWRHPERGVVEAAEFIEVAEQTGLIRPIGQRILEEACRQAEEWRRRYPQSAPMLSVNLSANQFEHQPDLVQKVIEETGLEPRALQVEITERAVMDDVAFARGKLEELKDLGVTLAIDDFGMGYSCLYHLKHMPLDSLKIDGAFVGGLGNDQGDEAIVSGTSGLAHALGVTAVVEGVETAEQQAMLRELGCDLAQGYHFASPLPGAAMEKVLANGASYQ